MTTRDRSSRENGDYSLGAVVRLTGLSDHTIRAWERRYEAVRPARSPKGTRRYSQAEIERLQLLRAAVDAGHRIGDIARLSNEEIERRLDALPKPERRPLDEIREAADRLDVPEVERLLGLQLAALGPTAFCREVASPLLNEAGSRWESGEGSIATEHLLSSATRGLLGAALRGARSGNGAPHLVFTTPEGERHELGALIAAVTAAGEGADVTYLGPELPAEDLAAACETIGAHAVGLSVVTLPPGAARRYLQQLRDALPERIVLWVGGVGATVAEETEGVDCLDLEGMSRALSRLERRSRAVAPRASRA